MSYSLRRILLGLFFLLLLGWLPTTFAQPASVEKIWGGSGMDEGSGVAVDNSGNVYVAGSTDSVGAGPSHVFLLKYDGSGNLLWQRGWGGSNDDFGASVAVDVSGNVYVTGDTSSFGAGLSDVFLLKFDWSGNLLFQKTWGGTSSDVANSVAVDSSGNLYVTGDTFSFGAGESDAFLLKFDSTGHLLYQHTWGGSGMDEGNSVAVDNSGNVYVAGSTDSFGAGLADVVLLKFTSSGSLLRQTTWGGSGTDQGKGVAVDSSGNAYVTGSTDSFGAGLADVVLLKFTSSGSLLYQTTWGGVGNDVGASVTVDPVGFVYVTGSTDSFGVGGRDVVLLVYDPYGDLQFQKTWGGTSEDVGDSVAVGFNGTAFVTGFTHGASHTLQTVSSSTTSFPSGLVKSSSGTVASPATQLSSPTGTITKLSGSQSYAGLDDAFLIGIAVQVKSIQRVSIPLRSGWNLISLPLIPNNPAITAVLKAQIASGEVAAVWTYGGTPQTWKVFIPNQPSTLSIMVDGSGYWIYMRSNDTLYVAGTVLPVTSAPPTYTLLAGWNLVGFKPEPSVTEETVQTYLSSIAGSYDPNNVWIYNNLASKWIRASGSTELLPGQAIWVILTTSAVLKP